MMLNIRKLISPLVHHKNICINFTKGSISQSSQSIEDISSNRNIEIISNTVADGEEFPVLNILPYAKAKKENTEVQRRKRIKPRASRLAPDHDWTKVWPGPRNFHPSTVPLPLHMSYVPDEKLQPPVAKYNNPELLKIPNFLHLTPVMVKNQCEVLKKFCTKWPVALKTDEDCDEHFPLTITTNDFFFSGPSIRWPESRIVEMKLKMKNLILDDHSTDKMKRLLHDRYNAETDEITIRTESCPLRKQNLDYAEYLLTVVYFESWVENRTMGK
ncbi:hypothetical protein SSS_02709 [Sarcoptes scabiei]|nr:hypothetical protein SSS_02709 [Sarcoptes scabiei]